MDEKRIKIGDLFNVDTSGKKFMSANKIKDLFGTTNTGYNYVTRKTSNNGVRTKNGETTKVNLEKLKNRVNVLSDWSSEKRAKLYSKLCNEYKDRLCSANTISFAEDTGISFYQASPYFVGNKVLILSPLKNTKVMVLFKKEPVSTFKLTMPLALYFTTAINKSFKNKTWGNSFSRNMTANANIKLPSSMGLINLDYMNNFVKQHLKKELNKLKNHVSSRLNRIY